MEIAPGLDQNPSHQKIENQLHDIKISVQHGIGKTATVIANIATAPANGFGILGGGLVGGLVGGISGMASGNIKEKFKEGVCDGIKNGTLIGNILFSPLALTGVALSALGKRVLGHPYSAKKAFKSANWMSQRLADKVSTKPEKAKKRRKSANNDPENNFQNIFQLKKNYFSQKATEEQKLIICDHIITLQSNILDLTIPQKIILLEIIANQLKIEKNIDNINKFEKFKSNLLQSLFIQLPTLLDQYTNSLNEELEKRQNALFALSKNSNYNPNINHEIDEFLNLFTTESNNRFKLLEFNPIPYAQIISMKKILAQYEKPIKFDEHYKLKMTTFKKSLIEITNFYLGLYENLQNYYTILIDQLSHYHLKLPAPIPLTYNYDLEAFILINKERLDNLFSSEPKTYPVKSFDLNKMTIIDVKDSEIYHNLKDNYTRKKVEMIDPMNKCLPQAYPFNMPNFLSMTLERNIKIKSETDFKKLISEYSIFFYETENLMKDISSIISELISLKIEIESCC